MASNICYVAESGSVLWSGLLAYRFLVVGVYAV